MFKDNLISLRKLHKMSQEALAEHLDVSRQTVSKWENAESLPDLEKAQKLAELFDVTIDDLITYNTTKNKLPVPPKGKHIFGTVKVGEKGQIVIPAKARRIFDIKAGDELVILGDESSGLAMLCNAQGGQFCGTAGADTKNCGINEIRGNGKTSYVKKNILYSADNFSVLF